MLEGPEVEPHMHHKTGHSLTDKILAILAIFLSGVSVYIAINHGRTMERLVAANSWPNLSYSTGNLADDNKRKEISFDIQNTGVGPARIDSVELFYNGQPISSAGKLIEACCDTKGNADLSPVITSVLQDEVVPARDSIRFLIWPQLSPTEPIWQALNLERFKVRLRICYCSVFEECWVRDSAQRRPTQVEMCKPSQPITYK